MANALTRSLQSILPTYFEGTKRNHYSDFGWPTTLTLDLYRNMYLRNAIAGAAVDKTAAKTWQDDPEIWESEEPTESALEKAVRTRFEDIRLWHHMREVDVRAMASGYAGLIFRFADNQMPDQPVAGVTGGLNGLAEVIPAWAHELTVAEWHSDLSEPDLYGKPKMFMFEEADIAIAGAQTMPGRKFQVHPDRVLIWSADGTVRGRSLLMQGYNALVDIEKVLGASGEGLWKNAKSAPIFRAPENTTLEALATAMGTTPDKVGAKLDEAVEAYQTGVDASLLLFGLTRESTNFTVPSPEHFFAITLQAFAASVGIPVKILIGNITGERSSTEDAKQWDQHCASRRNSYCKPLIREMINRFKALGILGARNWTIGWTDLTESSQEERLEIAGKMAEIHAKFAPDPVFMADEIREVTGHDPRETIEGFDTDPDPEAVDDDDPPSSTENE